MTRRLFLVRHCASTGQYAAAPLTPAGHKQAIALADHLAQQGVDGFISSPYTRAQQSIAPLANRLNYVVETDAHLVESALSSEPIEDWRAALQRLFEEPDFAWPGGESSHQAMRRGRTVLDAILARPLQAPVVMTHGRLMTLILRSFQPHFGFQTWTALSNPDVYQLMIAPDQVQITRTWNPDWVREGEKG